MHTRYLTAPCIAVRSHILPQLRRLLRVTVQSLLQFFPLKSQKGVLMSTEGIIVAVFEELGFS